MKYTVAGGLQLILCLLVGGQVGAQPAPQISAISAPQVWQGAEFRVTNLPTVTNPFDPALIRVDGRFFLPSGRTLDVPAFWYQAYQRALLGGNETLTLSGAGEWRLRFTPPETGNYTVSVTVLTNNQFYGASASTFFSVPASGLPARSGYVRVRPGSAYFETGDGQPLRLVGENLCYPSSAGTYDYDTWFAAMQAAGENYARIWMVPWAFGIESGAHSLRHYGLDHAWQLDYVLRLAEQRGIYVLLCLDYHGMFKTQPDYWGGNNFWPLNPYNTTNGGPCINQNAFFTNTTAQSIYRNRLRYLVGRYGYSQNLLAWEFFNEIDNDYTLLNATNVATWHGLMGSWLHTNDPFGHLVTTSLTSGSDRPELWSLPQLDFTSYHSYGAARPALRLGQVAQSFLSRYRKPVMIGEYGTDWRGWNRSNDPYLRGFRQGIWGGALGGSSGTGMPWWWKNIQSDNAYPIYAALGAILNRTGWGRGGWTNIGFHTVGPPPAGVGSLITNGQPFTAVLTLSNAWAGGVRGQLAVANAASAEYSTLMLDSFVQGTAHAELQVPFRLNAWVTNNARLVMHLNSVSGGAVMVVRVDGGELWRTNLPNLDGVGKVNNEYNLDIPVDLPSGKRSIEITNAGADWFYLDWVRLENVLPAAYSPDWTPSPDAIGLRGSHESLLYVVAPGVSFPDGATNSDLPVQHGRTVTLTNWPSGHFYAEWYDPCTGIRVGRTEAATTNGMLTLPLQDFRTDLAGIVYPPPALRHAGIDTSGAVTFLLDSESGGRYTVESSADLINWTPFALVTNTFGTLAVGGTSPANQRREFFRAKQSP
ncbi:MAG TPA: DUF5060 domain-containing protein [Verrucomicrobiae bacterium]